MVDLCLFKNCLLLLCAAGLDTHCVSTVQTSSSEVSQHSLWKVWDHPWIWDTTSFLKKMSEAACFWLNSLLARKVAIASWGQREGCLKQMWAQCQSVTWGCLSSKRRGELCPLQLEMEHNPGSKAGIWVYKDSFKCLELQQCCKVPGHMEVWREGRMQTSRVWGSEGNEKCASRLSGLSVGGYGRWDEAVPGEGIWLNAQPHQL